MQSELDVLAAQMRAQLSAAHPGKLFLTLPDACAAIGIAQKTLANWRSGGVTPLKISRVGQKRLVAVTEVAEVAARVALGEEVKAPARPRPADVPPHERRGRPSNQERSAAKARGMTVTQFRSAQKEGGAA